MKRVLLTGATDFIRRQLSIKLTEKDFGLVTAVRCLSDIFPETVLQVVVNNLTSVAK